MQNIYLVLKMNQWGFSTNYHLKNFLNSTQLCRPFTLRNLFDLCKSLDERYWQFGEISNIVLMRDRKYLITEDSITIYILTTFCGKKIWRNITHYRISITNNYDINYNCLNQLALQKQIRYIKELQKHQEKQ
jgi:hypothetical protein